MQPKTRALIDCIDSGFTPEQADMIVEWAWSTKKLQERLEAGEPYTPITAPEIMAWSKELVEAGLTEQQALCLSQQKVEIEQRLLDRNARQTSYF